LLKQEQILVTYLQKGQVSWSNILAIGLIPIFVDLLLQIDNKLVAGNANHVIAVISFEEVPEVKFGHQNVEDRFENRYFTRRHLQFGQDGRHVHVCECS
jgi:hypothetical protein